EAAQPQWQSRTVVARRRSHSGNLAPSLRGGAAAVAISHRRCEAAQSPWQSWTGWQSHRIHEIATPSGLAMTGPDEIATPSGLAMTGPDEIATPFGLAVTGPGEVATSLRPSR
ncbi:MAG: hypothetical protein WD078_14680, partial [Woeseia sp.]